MTPTTSWADRPASTIQKAARIAGCLFAFLAIHAGAQPQPAPGGDPAATSTATATRHYREARRAFAGGDLATAADRFEAADRAGYDNPVIFYNLGVTYYKLGRYDEAEAAFATASTEPALAALSLYNLGLVAKKGNDYKNAAGWFRQAYQHPEADSSLKRLARKAIESVPRVRLRKPSLIADEETNLSDFLRFSFNAGYGQDSNIYRTPSASYVDLAAVGTPQVDPVPQSGSFVPVDADAEFRWGPFEHSYFSVRYDFDGKIYTDKIHKNANAFRNRFAIGGRAFIPKKNGYRYFRSHFAITRFDENYYDRTDGQDPVIGTIDISDRFKRTRFGPQAYYHRERGRLGYGFSGDAFINKYDNDFIQAGAANGQSLEYLDLTHNQYQLGAHVSWDLLKNTAIRLNYDHYRREYTQRKAKDATGVRFTDNDELLYVFHHAGVKLRQKLGRNLSLGLAYQYTIREDNFEGYDDYNRHTGIADLAFDSRRLGLEAGVAYRMYDFPNGFAFDLPAAGDKTLDTLYAHLEATVRLRQRYHLLFTALFDVVESTDPRSAFEKNQLTVGMRWEL